MTFFLKTFGEIFNAASGSSDFGAACTGESILNSNISAKIRNKIEIAMGRKEGVDGKT